MKVDYSRRFKKQAMRLDSVTKDLLSRSIQESKKASSITEISNCKKLSGYKKAYRIRVADHRAIFVIEVDDILFFEFIVSRGEIYSKKYRELLQGR